MFDGTQWLMFVPWLRWRDQRPGLEKARAVGLRVGYRSCDRGAVVREMRVVYASCRRRRLENVGERRQLLVFQLHLPMQHWAFAPSMWQ